MFIKFPGFNFALSIGNCANSATNMRIQLIFIVVNIFIIMPCHFNCYRIDFEKNAEVKHLSHSYFSHYNVKIIEELEMRACGISEINEDSFMNMEELKYLHLSDNNIEHLPTYVFSNLTSLKQLNLKFNRLKNLDPKLFQNLTELISLDLHNNYITKLDKNLLTNLKKLETLNLLSNKISVIETGAFDNNIQLQYIDLYNNHLTEIKNGTFANLINLNKLYLSGNKIKYIDCFAFPVNSSLTELILGYNNLEYLNPKIILNLKKLKYMSAFNNPWNCDFKLKKLVSSCKSIDLTTHAFYHIPTCAKPKRLANRKWNSLTDADFLPSIMNVTIDPNITFSRGESVKLSCRNKPGPDADDEPSNITELEWVYEDDTSIVDSLETANRPFIYKYVLGKDGTLWSNISIQTALESDARVYKCVLKFDDEVLDEKSQKLMVHPLVKPV